MRWLPRSFVRVGRAAAVSRAAVSRRIRRWLLGGERRLGAAPRGVGSDGHASASVHWVGHRTRASGPPPTNDLESAGTRRNRRFSRCGLFCHNCLTPYRVSGPSNTKIERSKISPPPQPRAPPSERSARPPPPRHWPPGRRPARQKTGGGEARRRGFGSDWGRICRARATRSQDTTRRAARVSTSYHLNQHLTEAAREAMVRWHQERARSQTN